MAQDRAEATQAKDVASPSGKEPLGSMESLQRTAQPCYSNRLVFAFLTLLRKEHLLPEDALRWSESLDPDGRVHVSSIHHMLERVVGETRDELLGVKAAGCLAMGDVGIFDFVVSSADTLRAALNTAGRYMRLLNDTLELMIDGEGERATVRFESRVVLPPAAEDYTLCGLVKNHAATWPEGILEDMDVWFRHAEPKGEDAVAQYRQLLGPVRIHFGAPFSGLGFPSRLLDQPMRTRDPKLHQVLVHYAETTLAALPRPESVTEKVRRLIVEQFAAGDYSLEDTARALRMSSRTLGRRLADEGTTFKGLVDDTRRRIALRYVAEHNLGLSEIALLAGFTETPSFYRAFRRWTGMTPSKYRWTHRGDLRGLR